MIFKENLLKNNLYSIFHKKIGIYITHKVIKDKK